MENILEDISCKELVVLGKMTQKQWPKHLQMFMRMVIMRNRSQKKLKS